MRPAPRSSQQASLSPLLPSLHMNVPKASVNTLTPRRGRNGPPTLSQQSLPASSVAGAQDREPVGARDSCNRRTLEDCRCTARLWTFKDNCNHGLLSCRTDDLTGGHIANPNKHMVSIALSDALAIVPRRELADSPDYQTKLTRQTLFDYGQTPSQRHGSPYTCP